MPMRLAGSRQARADSMSRSLSYLRRGLLGIAVVGSLGFGVTTALAAPNTTTRMPAICDNYSEMCYCGGFRRCVFIGTCECS